METIEWQIEKLVSEHGFEAILRALREQADACLQRLFEQKASPVRIDYVANACRAIAMAHANFTLANEQE